MKVYIAGAYTPADGREETRLANICLASETGKLLLQLGHTPFCPHTMTAGWEDGCAYEDFMRMDLEWLRAFREVADQPDAPEMVGRAVREGGLGDAVVGEVGFNTPYALTQHERLDFHHPKGGKAKYLEDPLKQQADRYQDNLSDHLREALT